jgi:hypothetical protein
MMNTNTMCFPNGTEMECWFEHNCESGCVKRQTVRKDGSWGKFKCAIQRDIINQYVSSCFVSERTYNVTREFDCPYKTTERKRILRTKKKDESPDLFDNE